MTRPTNEMDVAELVAAYTNAAVLHGAATRSGNAELAGRSHEQLTEAYRLLRGRGLDGQTALLPLLKHENPVVRLWASSHALEFAADEGEYCLIALASGPPLPEQLA